MLLLLLNCSLFCVGSSAFAAVPPPEALSTVPLLSTPALPTALSSGQLVTPSHCPSEELHIPQVSHGSNSGDLSLSMSTQPVPERLVRQIQSGRYIELRDLLWDNTAVRRQFEEIHGATGIHLLPVSARPRVREVTTLPTWISCYLTFLAVSTSDRAIRNRIVYAILLVREAMRHGGHGWLEYDRLFRQQAAIDPELQWNRIHPELQATTILSQRSANGGSFCPLCNDCDHTMAQCAMAQIRQVTTTNRPSSSNAKQNSRYGRICTSWNDGACAYPGTCNYRHVCSKCFLPSHTAKDCKQPPRSKGSTLAPRSGSSGAPSTS